MSDIAQKPVFGYYKKPFFTIFAVLIIPAIIILLLNTVVVEQDLRNVVSMSNIDLLKQTRTASDSVLEMVESGFFNLFSDENTKSFFSLNRDYSTFEDYSIVGNAKSVMANYANDTNNFIGNILFYNYANDSMITPYGQIKYGTGLKNNDLIKKLYTMSPYDCTWIDSDGGKIFDTRQNTITAVRFVYQNLQLKGLVAIELRASQFEKLLSNIHIRKTGQIIFMDKDFNAVMNAKGIESELLQKLKISFIKLSNTSGNFITVDYKGEIYIASSVTSKFNGWHYVALLPVYEIESSAESITQKVMSIFILAIAFFAIIAFTVAKGVYNPLTLVYDLIRGNKSRRVKFVIGSEIVSKINDGIMDIQTKLNEAVAENNSMCSERERLQKQLNDNTSRMREYFTTKVISGDINDEEEGSQLSKYLNIRYDARYCATIIECSDISCGQTNNNAGVDNKYRRMKFHEILTKGFEGSKIDIPVILFRDDGAINTITSFIDPQDKQVVECHESILKSVQNTIRQELGLICTISVGSISDTFQGISNSHRSAAHNLKYKFILGPGSIISNSNSKVRTVPLNNNYIKHIINSLHAENISEVIILINDYKNYLVNNQSDVSVIRFHIKNMMHVILQHIIEQGNIKQNTISELNYAFNEFDTRFESIDQAIKYICKVLEEIADMPDATVGMLASKTIKIIGNEFGKDLKLNEIANRLNVSVPYLSRVFRESTGKNFKEYLIEYKVEKSKELIKNTNRSIQEIATTVGYSDPNQFIRIFKKYESITPTQYRMMKESGMV